MSNAREFVENVLMQRLEKAHWASPDKLHFRCPLCGDSKKDPNKTRGGILLNGDAVAYNCFNCLPGISFADFLKQFDYSLYRQYRLGNLRGDVEKISLNQKTDDEDEEVKPVEYPDVDQFDLGSVLNLSSTHPAVVYLNSRKILKSRWEQIYFSENFFEIAATYSDSKSNASRPAIVFPFRKRDSSIFGFQARYMEGKFRYQTAIIDRTIPKVIGLDRLNLDKRVHVFEGFFDSCFTPNSVAVLDSAIYQRVQNIDEIDNDQTILWYDNEPFNRQIMKMKREAIDAGFRVAFYPSEFAEHGKDLNDFVINTDPKTRTKILSKMRFEKGVKARLLHIENLKGT